MTEKNEYEVWVCEECGTQCDPDGHWGCKHRYTSIKRHIVSINLPPKVKPES